MLLFFFFFQAEDGIRDVAVTEFRRVLFRSCPPGRSLASRMMTSWPACVSSYPATNPASPAPIMRILLAGAACGSGLGTELQPCCDAQCAEAADAPSFRKARRSMGMGTAYFSGCLDARQRLGGGNLH